MKELCVCDHIYIFVYYMVIIIFTYLLAYLLL